MSIDGIIKNVRSRSNYPRICTIRPDYLLRKADIPNIEKKLKTSIGIQLSEFLLSCGELECGDICFFGVSTRENSRSKMINQTITLRRKYPKIDGYIVFEDRGDGNYTIVDSADNVSFFVPTDNVIVNASLKLYEYIESRLINEDNNGNEDTAV